MLEILPARKNAIKPKKQGVYGLVDPRTKKVRYIGTSTDLSYRVYSHLHSINPRSRTPKDNWVRELASIGECPKGVLLCEVPIPKTLRGRHSLEADWISRYHLVGEADLNSRLTPIGHPYGQCGPKQLALENYQLRQHIAELEKRLSEIQAVEDFI